MAILHQTKQVILGDGVDAADVYIDGEVGEAVEYTLNGTIFHEVLLDDCGGFGRAALRITCDTPNSTVVVQCGEERAIIHVVGAP